MWYISLDYINHQTSLTADQARTDPDGMIRFVISERDPGRRQLARMHRAPARLRADPLAAAVPGPDGPTDGPPVEVVAFDEPAARLPFYEQARVTPAEYAARIAARQAAVAARMLG